MADSTNTTTFSKSIPSQAQSETLIGMTLKRIKAVLNAHFNLEGLSPSKGYETINADEEAGKKSVIEGWSGDNYSELETLEDLIIKTGPESDIDAVTKAFFIHNRLAWLCDAIQIPEERSKEFDVALKGLEQVIAWMENNTVGGCCHTFDSKLRYYRANDDSPTLPSSFYLSREAFENEWYS